MVVAPLDWMEVTGLYPRLPFPGEGMQQKDGIVHCDGQLQDGRCTKGEKGDFPQKDIGTHVDDNGHAHDE